MASVALGASGNSLVSGRADVLIAAAAGEAKTQLKLGVEVTGHVEDVRPYYWDAAVFVAPLRYGGGIKNKVLYAMARGLPVVATGIGVEGIDGLASPATCPPCPRVQRAEAARRREAHRARVGVADARAGRVRFVGTPADRIKEDYLRILRLFRFQELRRGERLAMHSPVRQMRSCRVLIYPVCIRIS